jgi:pimeloyl-ACP methyl ester carboxylesterase
VSDLSGAAEPKSLSLPRRRDGQQWILDWAIKQAGREQNFEYDDRTLPQGIKSHAMIPSVTARFGQRCERLARRAAAHGHDRTALDLFLRATQLYRQGQHAIFVADDPDKAYLYERIDACYDEVIRLNADYRLERVEVPWNGVTFSGLLHLVPGEERLPTALLLPGMDMSKESYPSPLRNVFVERGMNVLAIDGPGQGSSNLRKLHVTEDNYESAAKAAVTYLAGRPEVDEHRIAVVGLSMGSYWAFRHAAIDERVRAVATAAGCYGTKTEIFESSSPRFKQIFMYMAGIESEDEFDRMAARMHLKGWGARVSCPALVTAGQFDPLTPLADAIALYDDLAGPKELWVLENDFHSSHRTSGSQNLAGMSVIPFMIDWLGDVLAGRLKPGHERKVFIRESSGLGPFSPEVAGFTLRDLAPAEEADGDADTERIDR